MSDIKRRIINEFVDELWDCIQQEKFDLEDHIAKTDMSEDAMRGFMWAEDAIRKAVIKLNK